MYQTRSKLNFIKAYLTQNITLKLQIDNVRLTPKVFGAKAATEEAVSANKTTFMTTNNFLLRANTIAKIANVGGILELKRIFFEKTLLCV